MRKSSTLPVIFDICDLKCMTSGMSIDNKAVLFCLLCLRVSLEDICKVTEWQTAMWKKMSLNNWQMLQNWKIDRDRESFEDPTDAKKLPILIKI